MLLSSASNSKVDRVNLIQHYFFLNHLLAEIMHGKIQPQRTEFWNIIWKQESGLVEKGRKTVLVEIYK